MWSSRIWIICSQMLYWGLLLEDVQVHLGAQACHREGRLHRLGAKDAQHTPPTPAAQPAGRRLRGESET